MTTIKGIYTIRDTSHPHYWDIVFEWEDQFSATLGIPLIPVGSKYDKIYQPGFLKKFLNRINFYQLLDYFFVPKGFYLAFHIGPPGVYSFHTRNDVVPIIIDFWQTENIKKFQSVFRHSLAVFVTSREVFNYLKSNNVKLNLKHISLSLPDKIFNQTNSMLRDIDIIQIGRSNKVFDEYMVQFMKDFPSIHYVCATKLDDQIQLTSNKLGLMGIFKEREAFIRLLQRAKISLVSAPGLDEDETRTGGFSPVTPRFLESAACGCRLLALYPDNADFNYYGIKEICVPIKNYDQFKILASEYINEKNLPDFTTFLEKHVTSKKASELLSKLDNQ